METITINKIEIPKFKMPEIKIEIPLAMKIGNGIVMNVPGAKREVKRIIKEIYKNGKFRSPGSFKRAVFMKCLFNQMNAKAFETLEALGEEGEVFIGSEIFNTGLYNEDCSRK